MDDTEASLDEWCDVVMPPGEQMDSMVGQRRFGSPETYVALVSDLGEAIDLLFSTTLVVEADADAAGREWCAAINRDAGLNRFVIYLDGAWMIERQLVLPKQPGASAAAMYLAGAAVAHQYQLRDIFAEGGPTAVTQAIWTGVQAADLSGAPLAVVSALPATLQAAARARLPEALHVRPHPRGVSLVLNEDASSLRLLATVDASLVDHPIWGPSLDRVLVVSDPGGENNVDLAATLNRSRLPGVSGSGAWCVSPGGELTHRLTLPLAVLSSAEEITGDATDGAWLFDWLFDTVTREMVVLENVLLM